MENAQPKTFSFPDRKDFQAIDSLKFTLIALHLLILAYSGGHVTFDTNAFNVQIKGVSLQKQLDDTTKLFGYWSRSHTNTEQQYDTTQQECLAIVQSVFLFSPCLECQQFTIQTDYDALKRILDLANSTGPLACWHLRLSKYYCLHPSC